MNENIIREVIDAAVATPPPEQPKETNGVGLVNAEAPEPLNNFDSGSGRFVISETDGISFIGKDSDGAEKHPLKICSWLIVQASTRDNNGNAWGRLLCWKDGDKGFHKWACPMELFSGDGSEFRAELLRGGLTISPSRAARDLLAIYIQSYPTEKRARCVNKLGWFAGRYVLPMETIGSETEIVVFQNPNMIEPAFSVSGVKEQWRENVASAVSGNSRLEFAISFGLAGPLLDIAGIEGGGFHLCGASSKGKSTAQQIASSVWGDPEKYKRSWRSTANALEGAALLHNDGVLVLDEIKEISPREAGAAVYMLANGQVKGRASRNGAARKIETWRILTFSSGEIGLSELLRQVGERTHAGQEIRLAEIPIGDFEDLHGYETPGQFADALRAAAGKYYGAVGFEYLRRLVDEREEHTETIRQSINNFVSTNVPAGASGQVSRVARRFGLVAVAGELATSFDLTGWQKGAAITAAQICFLSWLENFGTGDRERTQILEQVKAFFEAHGASRFGKLSESDEKVLNRAGFYSTDEFCADTTKTFYVMPEIFKMEVCKGHSLKTAVKTLIDAGWLMPGSDKASQTPRIPAFGKPTRVYVINGKMWEDNEPCAG